MTQLFKEEYLTGEVRFGTAETIYTRYGDVFAGLCLALSAVIIVLAYRRKVRG